MRKGQGPCIHRLQCSPGAESIRLCQQLHQVCKITLTQMYKKVFMFLLAIGLSQRSLCGMADIAKHNCLLYLKHNS